MAYAIQAGIQISLDSVTWYRLTDHNRSSIDISSEVIERQSRMANGIMRRYVISKKDKISTSWNFLPTKPSELVDSNYGAAWISAFYNANNAIPVYVKIINAKDSDVTIGQYPSDTTFVSSSSGTKIYKTFITDFSKTILKRTAISDYLDMSIEFTEI